MSTSRGVVAIVVVQVQAEAEGAPALWAGIACGNRLIVPRKSAPGGRGGGPPRLRSEVRVEALHRLLPESRYGILQCPVDRVAVVAPKRQFECSEPGAQGIERG